MEENTLFAQKCVISDFPPKTMLLQRELFLTMLFTINISPLLVTKVTIILSNSQL